METPDNLAGQITDHIMMSTASRLNSRSIIHLEVPIYNRMWSRIYEVLCDFGLDDESMRGGGCDAENPT